MPLKPLTTMTRAFTIIELMVVVAILAALAALVLVGVQRLDASAMSAADLARQRQISHAQSKFAADHEGRLFHPRTEIWTTDPYPQFVSDPMYAVEGRHIDALYKDAIDRFWVRDYNPDSPDLPRRLVALDGGDFNAELPKALSDGAAWDYLDGSVDAYRSPMDPSTRIRSYSLNGFVGVNVCAEDFYWPSGSTPPGPFTEPDFVKYAVPCATSMSIKQPAKTMCSIAEDDPAGANMGMVGFNHSGFLVHPDQDTYVWYDIPALWDPNRINISNMDGSTHSIRVSDPDLGDKLFEHGVVHQCPELLELQQRLLPGVLEFRTQDDLPG